MSLAEHVSEMAPGANQTGTKEWAEHSANCARGCRHDCRYCYARANALRFKQIASVEEWRNEVPNWKAANKRWGKKSGIIMFPTSHDITEGTFDACVSTLRNILAAGNRVLVVSKPTMEIIQELLKEISASRDQITFRFSIGTDVDQVAEYWEPGAPSPVERLATAIMLRVADHKVGFSMEPALDPDVIPLSETLIRHCTDQVWIGAMNRPEQRWVKEGITRDDEMMAMVKANSTPEAMREVYARFKDNPKVQWKDSYRRVLGLDALPPPSQR